MPLSAIDVEFAIEQRYSIKPAEGAIDTYLDEFVTYSCEQDREEARQRFKRMYRAIVANEEALSMVLHYSVLVEHDASLLDEEEGYVERYFQCSIDFGDIITRLCHLFHPEDRQWWEDLVEADQLARKQQVETENGFDMFDLVLQIGPLQYAFSSVCQLTGWSFMKLERQHNDCEVQP